MHMCDRINQTQIQVAIVKYYSILMVLKDVIMMKQVQKIGWFFVFYFCYFNVCYLESYMGCSCFIQ
jgi:hypothetical protein